MLVVGLTGGIATGKSTVARFLSQYGAAVIDADEISREIIVPETRVFKEIVNQFGSEILSQDGTIDRTKLGRIVFSDLAKLKILNEITHPPVIKIIKSKLKEFKKRQDQKIVVIDVPLLIEAGLRPLVDFLVVVTAQEKTQIKRLQERGLTLSEAKKRIKAQMPLSEKAKLADYVIENDGALEELEQKTKALWFSVIASPFAFCHSDPE